MRPTMRRPKRTDRRRLHPHRPSSERGQSLVELALTLTLLLVLFSGIVDLGRVFFTFVTLRDAAQEGAAFAATDPYDSTGVERRARETSSNPVDLGDTRHVQVAITPVGGTCVGNGISVQVSYNSYPLITPFLPPIIGSSTITLTAEVTDTILSSDC